MQDKASPIAIPPAGPNGLAMSLEGVNVIKVGLPVLDEAAVIRGDHPLAVVTPAHAPHGAVVSLSGRRGEGGRDNHPD